MAKLYGIRTTYRLYDDPSPRETLDEEPKDSRVLKREVAVFEISDDEIANFECIQSMPSDQMARDIMGKFERADHTKNPGRYCERNRPGWQPQIETVEPERLIEAATKKEEE